MKKLIIKLSLIFLTSSLTTSLLSAEVTLPSHFNKVNFEISDNWTQLKQKRKNIVSFKYTEDIATLNIRQSVMSKPVTANALKDQRAKFTYDSWMNVYERHGTVKENTLSNVNESYVGIFLSQSIDSSLNIIEKISGEYYYITDKNYYIITVQTTKKNWKKLQPELKEILNSFWIGEGEKPIFIPEEKNEQEWEQKGKSNNNNNYIQTSPLLEKPLNKQWGIEFNNPNTIVHEPLFVHDIIYLLKNDNLTALNLNGKKKWTFSFSDNFQSFISYKSDTLFIIKESPKNEILGIMANNGQILFKIDLNNTITHPIIINESILYIENTVLKSASRLTGKLEWAKNLNLNDTFRLVSNKHYIIAYNFNKKIICVDSRNGKVLWKSNKEVNLKYDPVIIDNNLFVIDEGDTDQILNYNLENGDVNWFYNKAILNLKITSTPSVNNELLVIQTLIDSKSLKNNPINNTMLFGIDISTGKLNWEKETSPITQRPIITENLIFYTINNSNIIVLDTLSGKNIPLTLTSENNEEMILSQINIYKDSIYSLLKSDNKAILTANK